MISTFFTFKYFYLSKNTTFVAFKYFYGVKNIYITLFYLVKIMIYLELFCIYKRQLRFRKFIDL